jgi:hypothetical protein
MKYGDLPGVERVTETLRPSSRRQCYEGAPKNHVSVILYPLEWRIGAVTSVRLENRSNACEDGGG